MVRLILRDIYGLTLNAISRVVVHKRDITCSTLPLPELRVRTAEPPVLDQVTLVQGCETRAEQRRLMALVVRRWHGVFLYRKQLSPLRTC